MEVVTTSLLCLAVALNSIESSSQSERSPDEGQYPASPRTLAQPTARDRSRSPALKRTFRSVLGFEFEDLENIRLRPHNNPNRIYELRRYIFPQDKPIGFRKYNQFLNSIPTGEQIVVSTSNGDVFAILGKTLNDHTILRAICTPISGRPERAKINVNSGKVKALTKKEIEDCPVSTKDRVTKMYGVLLVSSQSNAIPHSEPTPGVHRCEASSSSSSPGRNFSDATQSLPSPHYFSRFPLPAEPSARARLTSPTLRQLFPRVLGYRFDEITSIRLIPHNYPTVRFKLRIYTFPRDEPIGLRTRTRIVNPMPEGEQIVLSNSNGDVCAVFEKYSDRRTDLRPIFTSILGITERVKINMNSSAVEQMTTEEIAKCPITSGVSITKLYKVSSV